MKKVITVIIGVILLSGCGSRPNICEKASYLETGFDWRYPGSYNFQGSVCYGDGAAYFSENGYRSIRSVRLESGTSRWTHSFGEYYTYLLNYSNGVVLCESLTQKSTYQQDDKSVLTGIDGNTGEELFAMEIPRQGGSIARIGTAMATRSNPYVKSNMVVFGTSHGYLYQYDLSTCQQILSHSFHSAPAYGPFEWKEDLFWVLESGSIVKLNTSEGEFEEIVIIDETNYCFGAVLSADGTLLCEYDRGKMALYDLDTGNAIWEKSISRSPIRPAFSNKTTAFVYNNGDILEISLEDGSTLREAPFDGLFDQVFELPAGYLFNMGSCMVVADHELQPSCIWWKSGYEDMHIRDGVLFYVERGLAAISLDSLCRRVIAQ